MSDYIGARALLSSLPKVKWLLGDRGYDADWLREVIQDTGISACILGRKQRKTPVKYEKRRYKRRSRIEIMFGRLKDWRRVTTRYDRCPKVFLSAIALAALVIYWLGGLTLERPAHPCRILDRPAIVFILAAGPQPSLLHACHIFLIKECKGKSQIHLQLVCESMPTYLA